MGADLWVWFMVREVSLGEPDRDSTVNRLLRRELRKQELCVFLGEESFLQRERCLQRGSP